MKVSEIDSLSELDEAQAKRRLAIAAAKKNLGDALGSFKDDLPGIFVSKILVPAGLVFVAFKGLQKIPDIFGSDDSETDSQEDSEKAEKIKIVKRASAIPILIQLGRIAYDYYQNTHESESG